MTIALSRKNAARRIADRCADDSSDGDVFARVAHGDDERSTSLFVRKADAGLLIADQFVLDGPFVFSVRVVAARNSAIHEGIASSVIDIADRQFQSWVDDQS